MKLLDIEFEGQRKSKEDFLVVSVLCMSVNTCKVYSFSL